MSEFRRTWDASSIDMAEAEGDVTTATRNTRFYSRHNFTCLGVHSGDSAVALIQIQRVGFAPFHDVKIEQPVVVHVAPDGVHVAAVDIRAADARLFRDCLDVRVPKTIF